MQPSAAAPLHSELAPAPRAVPASFVLAELLPFRWWYIFALFLVAVYAIQLRGARTRLALLKWG